MGHASSGGVGREFCMVFGGRFGSVMRVVAVKIIWNQFVIAVTAGYISGHRRVGLRKKKIARTLFTSATNLGDNRRQRE